MYRMIVVDDDVMTRRGINEIPFWNKLGIKIMGEASDGEGAVDLIEQLLPDILLTDVKMPCMDGIALAEWVRSKYVDLKLVFISGYDDVKYLKSAFKVSAYDYILKPIDAAELENCFTRLVDELDHTTLRDKEIKRLLEAYNVGAHFLQENLLNLLLSDNAIEKNSLKSVMDAMSVRFDQKRFAVLTLKVIDPGGRVDVMKTLTECKEEDEQYPYIINRQEDIYCVVLIREGNIPVAVQKKKARDILYALRQAGAHWAFAGICEKCGELAELHAMFQRALYALRHWFHSDDCTVLTPSDGASETTAFPGPPEDLELIVTSAGDGALVAYVDGLFAGLANTRQTSKVFYINCLSFHLNRINDLLCRSFSVQDADELSLAGILEDLSKSACLKDMKRRFGKHCTDIRNLLLRKNDKTGPQSVLAVKRRIRLDYDQNLTLERLAEEVHLAPTYLCMLFREETGQTISDYLTGIRMEKARELLTDHRIKLYDIGEAVGYNNSSYFARQFKKYAGVSPSEYRATRIRQESL